MSSSSAVETSNKNKGGNNDDGSGGTDAAGRAAGQPGGGNRHQLVQRLLDSSASLPAFVNDLLTTQAVTVAGTEAAGFLIERNGDQASLRPIAHIRPDQSSPEVRAQALAAFQDLIRPCVEQNRDGAIEVSAAQDGGEAQYCLITLLRADGEVVGVSSVVTRCMNLERAKQRLMSMQLVAGYFELFTLRRNSDQSRMIAQSHQHVLQLATSVATAEGFQSAAMNLCNELATRTGSSRVSIGWLKGNRVRVKALSHTEQFDKRQELIVQLERAMEECLDQEEIVQYEPDGTTTQNVTREAQALSRAQGGNTVISIPLRRQSEIIGVLTLEFAPGSELGPQAATGLAVAADLLAPQLYDRYQNDRWLITKTGISLRETAKIAIGPKHMLAKAIIILVIGALVFMTLYKPMYRVSATFAFAPLERRVLDAPFDGQIREVFVEPGAVVTEGQPLVALSTFELITERSAAEAQMRQFELQAKAFRVPDPKDPQARIRNADALEAEAKRDEAKAKVDLLDKKIADAVIKAPFAGEVLEGDLKYKIGASVQRGDALIEIGKRDKLRGELKIADRDIQDVKVGQTGTLKTSSLPGDEYPIRITNVIPKPNAAEGDNRFLVHAEVEKASAQWLPGITGEARIDVRNKPLIWIWTHRLTDFVQLKLWSWGII